MANNSLSPEEIELFKAQAFSVLDTYGIDYFETPPKITAYYELLKFGATYCPDLDFDDKRSQALIQKEEPIYATTTNVRDNSLWLTYFVPFLLGESGKGGFVFTTPYFGFETEEDIRIWSVGCRFTFTRMLVEENPQVFSKQPENVSTNEEIFVGGDF